MLTAKKINSGSNCVGMQGIILPESWEQKDEFREILYKELQNTKTDPCYYPGSKERVEEFVEKYGGKDSNLVTEVVGPMVVKSTFNEVDNDKKYDATHDIHPHVIECGVFGTSEYNDYAIKNEAFGPVLAIVELPDVAASTVSKTTGDENIQYLLHSAIPFVNNKDNIFGSLSCILMYPQKYIRNSDSMREVISQLNYGTVCINTNGLVGYFSIAAGGQWGSCVHDTTYQSGFGSIGNSFMLKNVEKTVVYSRSLRFPLLLSKRRLLPSFCWDALNEIILFLRFKIPFR